jgi:hypothetical protein
MMEIWTPHLRHPVRFAFKPVRMMTSIYRRLYYCEVKLCHIHGHCLIQPKCLLRKLLAQKRELLHIPEIR